MSSYLISGSSLGGGAGARDILHLSLATDKSFTGTIAPPQQWFWEKQIVAPLDTNVMEYNKFTGGVELKQEGVYLLKMTMMHQIENTNAPLSNLTLYAVDNAVAVPTEVYLQITGGATGQDTTRIHTAHKYISVLKGQTRVIQFGVGLIDPNPPNTHTIYTTTFTGNEYLTNFTCERVREDAEPILDVFKP